MTVILSAKASSQLTGIFDYLESNFTPSVRKKFQQRLDRYISAVKLVPNGFPASDNISRLPQMRGFSPNIFDLSPAGRCHRNCGSD